MPRKPFTVLEAPSILGLFPKGVETLQDALFAAGLAKKLYAECGDRVDPSTLALFQGDHLGLLKIDNSDANQIAFTIYNRKLPTSLFHSKLPLPTN